jgi:BirA family biotin operon repressor/biotin-[acetyl-CoA-carboxylase] ligase
MTRRYTEGVHADDLAELASLLTTTRLGRTHEHHAELGSTNDRALAWLAAPTGPPDGTLITADAQTAGRGRLGRAWSSPAGRDLYASVVLRCGRAPTGFGALSLAVGVGLREGLLRALGDVRDLPRLGLKWPNDLLLGERKLGGILCESRWRGGEVDVVVGFGINVHRRRDEFEPELRERATSLALHLADDRRPGRAALLAAILHELERWLERFFTGGFAAIRSHYEPHCVVLGREVRVDRPSADGTERIAALALGLDPDGALRVRPREGEPFRVESADVWLAQPE